MWFSVFIRMLFVEFLFCGCRIVGVVFIWGLVIMFLRVCCLVCDCVFVSKLWISCVWLLFCGLSCFRCGLIGLIRWGCVV